MHFVITRTKIDTILPGKVTEVSWKMNVETILEKKNFFITGGSGFIGKILIEKILRTVANAGKIYLLVRIKKGKTPQDRVEEIFNNKVRFI